MRTVYDADDPLLAHLLVGVLSQAGIEARVLGDHLQGALGELPASGLIRVVVADHQFAPAREITEAWEDDLLTVHPDDLCQPDGEREDEGPWDGEGGADGTGAHREPWMGEGEPMGRVPRWMWAVGLAAVLGVLAWWGVSDS